MTKPRIRMYRSKGEIWWQCYAPKDRVERWGIGKTPTEAYDSWFEDQIPF